MRESDVAAADVTEPNPAEPHVMPVDANQSDLSRADDVQLLAYRLDDGDELPLMTSPQRRVWMDALPERFANRCLPLLIANQSGWLILNTFRIAVTWNGGGQLDDITIEYDEGVRPQYPVLSHFGGGIITWSLPYIFETPPGWSLHVRGPANCPKGGAYPLEGLVETDWGRASFTMNWHLTRPDHTVVFEVDEPVCQLLPVRREQIEQVRPVLRYMSDVPEVQAVANAWSEDRRLSLKQLKVEGSDAQKRGWQKDYFQGRDMDGTRQPRHRTRLKVRDFEIETPTGAGA